MASLICSLKSPPRVTHEICGPSEAVETGVPLHHGPHKIWSLFFLAPSYYLHLPALGTCTLAILLFSSEPEPENGSQSAPAHAPHPMSWLPPASP